MTKFPGARAQASHLFGGFAQARTRFDAATNETDPEPCFIALFETLNWSVAIDDYVRQVWTPDGSPLGWEWRKRADGEDLDELLNAARFARNLVHHHWADALVNDEGQAYPRTYPLRYFAWRWRPANELPAHIDPHKPHVVRNRQAYAQRFAGDQAEATLRDVAQGLELVEQVLATRRAGSHNS